MCQVLPQHFTDKTMAILVLYKSKLSESESYLSLTKSLVSINAKMDIVVYDNSPTPMMTESDSISDNWRFHYVHDKTNAGVSKAYNEGLRVAKKLNRKWLLLLDQDTFFPENAFVEYTKAVQDNPDIYLFAPKVISNNRIISPCRYFLNKGYSLRKIKPGTHKFHITSLVNSGMLIHVEAFERSGGYNEKIRLDFADHGFIGRYKANYSNFAVINLRCFQNFSGKQRLTLDSALARFALYCEGARNKAVNKLDCFVLMVVTILRTIKLSLTYMSPRFFVTFYNYFLARNSNYKRR